MLVDTCLIWTIGCVACALGSALTSGRPGLFSLARTLERVRVQLAYTLAGHLYDMCTKRVSNLVQFEQV